jgi:hypothetical protein
MTIRDQETPEFAYGLRGYDRLQVDDYVTRLREYTSEVEDRAIEAERRVAVLQSERAKANRKLEDSVRREADLRRQVAEAGGENLPQRLAQILELARDEAEEMRVRAAAEVDAANEMAADRAGKIVEAARGEAEQLRAGATAEEQAIRRRIDELATIKTRTVEQLVHIEQALRAAVEHVEPDHEADIADKVEDDTQVLARLDAAS